MSGIRVGSRLEQLETLRRRLDHEINIERQRTILDDHDGPHTNPARPPAGVGKGSDAVAHALLTDLGVTTRQVKEWAVHTGLLPTLARGRVALPIIEKYAAAHR